MKKSPWFYIGILAAVLTGLFFLTACSKSNDLAHATHQIQYWTDKVTVANSAWECPGDNTWITDTTLYYNNTPAKVVFGRPIVVSIDSVNGGFARKYFEYLN